MLSTVELLSFRTMKSASCYTVSRRSYHRGTHPLANRNAALNAPPGLLTASPPLNISSVRGDAAASKRDWSASWSSSFTARIRGSASRSVAGISVISCVSRCCCSGPRQMQKERIQGTNSVHRYFHEWTTTAGECI